MALEINLCKKIKADGTQIFIEDNTGLYNEATNPGGYGEVNPNRNIFALVFLTFYQPYNTEREQASYIGATVDYSVNHANNYSSKFTIEYLKDGWYDYNIIAVPTSVLGEDDNIYYDTTANELRQWNEETQLWVEVFNIEALLNPQLYSIAKQEALETIKLQIKLKDKRLEFISCRGCKECNCGKQLEDLIQIEQGIKSSVWAFQSSMKFEAQRSIEELSQANGLLKQIR